MVVSWLFAATALAGMAGDVRAATVTRLLAFGDSLTSGYGLAPADGFTAQLQIALQQQGLDVEVINAGVAGDTTAGGVSRLDWSLADHPDAVLLELGSNDALRALDPAVTRANLDHLLAALTGRHIPVLLAGMYAPPNLGSDYAQAFNSIFPDLARKYGVPLYPFFLDGVATEPHLNQNDGLHPNTDGVRVVVSKILPSVVALVGRHD
ncbi:MAG: arylesterase [Azospirillaceae bacterium]|nr:arylesterase [Azospirillaceae bacterium]